MMSSLLWASVLSLCRCRHHRHHCCRAYPLPPPSFLLPSPWNWQHGAPSSHRHHHRFSFSRHRPPISCPIIATATRILSHCRCRPLPSSSFVPSLRHRRSLVGVVKPCLQQCITWRLVGADPRRMDACDSVHRGPAIVNETNTHLCRGQMQRK